MHFRSDKKILELTKILELKNKGNYRGSVPIFRRPKYHFPKIFLVSVFWNTLVQVGVIPYKLKKENSQLKKYWVMICYSYPEQSLVRVTFNLLELPFFQ
jgi:hypothetical protein